MRVGPSAEGAAVCNVPVRHREDHSSILSREPCDQHLGFEPCHALRTQASRADYLAANEVSFRIEIGELRAGLPDTKGAEVDPELVSALACLWELFHLLDHSNT